MDSTHCNTMVRRALAVESKATLNPIEFPSLPDCEYCGIENELPYCAAWPFHAAAMMGELDAMKEAASRRSKNWIGEVDSRGFVPLHCAVLKGNEIVTEWLLSIGAEPDKLVTRVVASPKLKIMADVTSLYMASCLNDFSRPKIISLLLKYGADPNHPKAKDPVHGVTCLHNAAFFGELSAVQDLLKHGADVHAISRTGDSPATCARKGSVYGTAPYGDISMVPSIGLFRHGHTQIQRLLAKKERAQP